MSEAAASNAAERQPHVAMTVRDVFTFAWLLEEAGEGPLARGLAYLQEGRVSISRDEPDRVEAIVQGAEPYVVELLLEAGHPVWFCSCLAAAEGALCKHAVATALALAGTPATPTAAPTSAADVPAPGRKAVAAPDVRAWRKRVTSTFGTGGRFVEYRDAPESSGRRVSTTSSTRSKSCSPPPTPTPW